MTETITAEEYNALMAAEGKRAKYGNRKVERHGRTFDSVREADRYDELLLMQRAGKIADLECQVAYPLLGRDGTVVARYISDFSYFDKDAGAIVVEDVKSEITRRDKVYRLKAKLFRAQYDMSIREVLS